MLRTHRRELLYYVTSGSNVTRNVHWCVTVDYQQIENDNIANQIHGFTINYGKFIRPYTNPRYSPVFRHVKCLHQSVWDNNYMWYLVYKCQNREIKITKQYLVLLSVITLCCYEVWTIFWQIKYILVSSNHVWYKRNVEKEHGVTAWVIQSSKISHFSPKTASTAILLWLSHSART